MKNTDLSLGAAWMKGKVIPLKDASLPLNDWGLTRSDITYDVVTVIDGAFFRLSDYLDRFEASMSDMRLDPKLNRTEIIVALTKMVAASGLKDSYVSMVCSRGVPSVPGSRNPKDCENHFFAWCIPYVNIIPNSSRQLKTKSSERKIPLVGLSLWAAQQISANRNDAFAFPHYTNKDYCSSNSASAALNKWLKS